MLSNKLAVMLIIYLSLGYLRGKKTNQGVKINVLVGMKIAKHWLVIAYSSFSLNISLLAMLFLESCF